MATLTLNRALRFLEQSGVLLVFPIKDKPQIPSLWNCFFPGQSMTWDWSEEGDSRVPDLWHLRTELSTCGEAAYTKWFRNRGTLFSLELFTALLGRLPPNVPDELKLSSDALEILRALDDDSPQAAKALKLQCEMAGRENNSRFERAMRELWARFLVVAWGEVEEGGYPSLAVGSSRLLLENAWDDSRRFTPDRHEATISRLLKYEASFGAYYEKLLRSGILR